MPSSALMKTWRLDCSSAKISYPSFFRRLMTLTVVGAGRGRRSPRGGLREREVLDADARFLGPLAVGILLQKGLIGLWRVGVARLLPVAFFGQLLESRLSLRREFAARVLLQEEFVGIRGVRLSSLLPVALLAAAARQDQQRTTQPQHDFIAVHFLAQLKVSGASRYSTSICVTCRRRQARHSGPWTDRVCRRVKPSSMARSRSHRTREDRQGIETLCVPGYSRILARGTR